MAVVADQLGLPADTADDHTLDHSASPPQRRRKPLALRHKLGLILLLMWVGMIASVLVISLFERSAMLQERRMGVQQIVAYATSLLADYEQRVERGEMAPAQAREMAYAQLRTLRFDDTNYVFAVNPDGFLASHPTIPSNKSMLDFQDPSGKYLFRELIELGLNGGGFVNYQWERNKGEAPSAKVSYVQLFKPWNVIVGSGVYIEDVNAAIRHSLLINLALLGAIGALVTLVFWRVGRGIYRDIGGEPDAARRQVQAMAAGDFSSRENTRDAPEGSLLQAIEHMRADMAEVVAMIRDTAASVDSGAREIAAGNTQLSARTEQQAASLQQTAASMEQLSATVRQNADNAREVKSLSERTDESLKQGRGVMSEVVDAMHAVRDSSQQMAKIIEMIDGIAFQTNLLALNAAVEAARAGEHGRGFAVVASEVRQLAKRSADAAHDISQLVDGSASQVGRSTELVDKANETMRSIEADAHRVSALISEISAASQEQSSGIGQISEAVSQIDQVTQQNAALVEEAAASSSVLESNAGRMQQAVSRFTVA